MTSTLRRLLALILSPIAALTARAQEMAPSGYDPSDDVLYQIMPVAWRCSSQRSSAAAAAGPDAPIEVKHRFGDFGGMTESLDYLAGLGVTGVWMTPIFPSRAYHSYQHGAADTVNPWFGTEAEFIAFVRAAHERKLKVYIDLVAYGISQDSTWFRQALADPTGPAAGMLAITDDESLLKPGPAWKPKEASDARRFQGYDFRTWTGETIGIAWWDLRRPAPRELVTSWCRKWMDPDGDGDFADGVDGFRLDHVWAKYQSGPDGWGYNVREFWLPWKKDLQQVNPKVFTFAEQARWETNGIDLLPAHDAALAKPLLFAIRDAIVEGKAEKPRAALVEALKSIPDGRTLMGSIGDHDVDRIASSVSPTSDGRGGDAGNLEKARLAAAVLMVMPMPPIIYFGDEIGMLGRAGNYGSDANDIPRREPFKWTAVDAAGNPSSPMTDYWRAHKARGASVIDQRYSTDNDGRSVEEQLGKAGSLLESYKALIRLRRENIALRRGDYAPIKMSQDDPAVWCFARLHEQQKLVVAVNFSGEERTVAFKRKDAWNGGVIGPWEKTAAYKVLGTQSEATHRVTVPGWGVAVVEIE
ncbi:MAG: DUF3459 domain-containing protein [Phycisphaerales bacterium]|nr:DUF3459 domain-containing protein [Phycisphaerales bacterium]